ncbi:MULTISPECIES: TnsA endonuclease N-terminal domain-containing protein [unclassified Nostoc]|uniref:TnsA endonuclease N-terminal domain-containing protein n=1 Tax=unclassified Nostoc TaxID=2593658 RepID=UPI000D0BFD19|nr:TnsA endonuclease N-terminal domain-containing protein [Nostoc sp. 'Peltigera membranacea cyanobiont' N6]AVH63920.1 TnsA endonuclease [Nostoc sp. 'Peltigera membranacea cyanobiont' N6]
MYLLETDPDVLSYHSQPLSIFYTFNHRQRRYTPDFFVEGRHKKLLVEVKPASKVNSDKNLSLFRAIAPICEEKGWEFVVVTDAMIRVQPQLNNLKLIYKYAGEPLSINNALDCYRYFQRQVSTSIKTALLDLAPKQISINILLKLIFLGFLKTDLKQPISSNSPIYINQKALSLLEFSI